MNYFKSDKNFRQYNPKPSLRNTRPAPRFNPYQKNKPVLNRHYARVLVIFFGLLIVWTALMLFLPYFKINKITYRGLNNIQEADLAETVNRAIHGKSFLSGSNYFLLKTGNLADELKKSFPFNSVAVSKVFPNQLAISVQEKISSIIYGNGAGYYLLDQNASVIKELGNARETDLLSPPATSTAGTTATGTVNRALDYKKITATYGSYPILIDTRGLGISASGTAAISHAYLKGILAINDAVKKDPFIKINYFTCEDPQAGVYAVINRPWKVRFKLAGDATAQLTSLKLIMKNSNPAEYIDVRYGDHVYWK